MYVELSLENLYVDIGAWRVKVLTWWTLRNRRFWPWLSTLKKEKSNGSQTLNPEILTMRMDYSMIGQKQVKKEMKKLWNNVSLPPQALWFSLWMVTCSVQRVRQNSSLSFLSCHRDGLSWVSSQLKYQHWWGCQIPYHLQVTSWKMLPHWGIFLFQVPPHMINHPHALQ